MLTLYSLYKQVKEWDADEMPMAEEETPKDKYKMWLQQKGKPEIQCMKEYIVLISQHDVYTQQILEQVIDGRLKEIKFQGEDLS